MRGDIIGASEDLEIVRPCMSLEIGLPKADPQSDENEFE